MFGGQNCVSTNSLQRTFVANAYIDGSVSNKKTGTIELDASRSFSVYGASSTVQPSSLNLSVLIKY